MNSKKEKNIINIEEKNKRFLNNNDIFNISIKSLLNIWSKKMMNIIMDLTIFYSSINKYSSYFNNTENLYSIYLGITVILKDFIKIFLIDNRSMYFGITLIIVSILLYFLAISS